MSSYPMPMPFGWYALDFSQHLEKGDVKPLYYFGRDLVLFRTEGGAAHLLDAFCPHLGAHLGHGGKVSGEVLGCPFHGWQWGGDGSCANVPYADEIPPQVKKLRLRRYPIVEKNRVIYAWYHPKGAEPLWDVEAHETMEEGSEYETEVFDWKVKAPMQELAENSVDSMHFIYVHGIASYPEWEITYDGHRRRNTLKFEMNTQRPNQEGGIMTTSYGPGESIQLFTGISPMKMLGLSTPIDSENTHLRFVFFSTAKEKASSKVGEAIMREICRQVEQDIPIWENKAYCPRPLLAKNEKGIMDYRRHYAKFYVDYDEKARLKEMFERGEGRRIYMPGDSLSKPSERKKQSEKR